MASLNNTINFIVNHWSDIIIILAFIIGAVRGVFVIINMDVEKRKEIAMKIVRENLLKYMSDAEVQYSNYKKSGVLKRSQVINKIYTDYPVLANYVNQDELIEMIYKMIDDEMDRMNAIVNGKNPEKVNEAPVETKTE